MCDYYYNQSRSTVEKGDLNGKISKAVVEGTKMCMTMGSMRIVREHEGIMKKRTMHGTLQHSN